MKTALVIASNRPDRLREFIAAWSPLPWDHLVLVEDAPDKSPGLGLRPLDGHYCWADIRADKCLPSSADFFSFRSSAIKSYGFGRAVIDHEADAVFALDDDCYPVSNPAEFVQAHVFILRGGRRWVPSIDGFPTRGMPYDSLGDSCKVAVNMGLWSGVPDIDSVQALSGIRSPGVDFTPPAGSRLMHPRSYWPFCGMNIAFRSEALPLLYFPKMGEDSPYHRFDDIWAGVILQRCCRELGWPLTVGAPVVEHIRASNAFVNLEREAAGIHANEDFWQVIDSIDVNGSTPAECMSRIGSALRNHNGTARQADLSCYLKLLGGYILDWIGWLEKRRSAQ